MNNLKYTRSKHFEIEQITDGVYAAIAISGTGSVSNAGIIDLGDAALVFDTFNSQQAAYDLRVAAEELTGKKPAYVVNSHWHGDHIRGNQVFEDAAIIATHETFELMNRMHPDRIRQQIEGLPNIENYLTSLRERLESTADDQIKLGIAQEISSIEEVALSLQTLRLTLPNLLFDTKLSLYGSKRKVELISVGAAHTANDMILYLPEEQIVFAADIVLVDTHPMMLHGDPAHWLVALDQLRELPIKTLVPGHGPLGDWGHINRIQAYIRGITADAKQFIQEKRSIESLSEVSVPTEFAEWGSSKFYHDNVKFVYERIQQLE
ncbi:MBL fold metallo-hydrolase [Paenibacillus albiflavus]|uniref:MBL fold metallo-hydrolase n=1 Tax=Paenibacillus albiflavus TaxID=2545760 RepID=A0A4R4EL42_9BACL|nr:MBL fold metallo-hydrolase [Paenibacillus albiflavus]TCZ80050.1 MBL fold metallo-hydrolase [Paenibacillus albiflavus]